ncbi:MAG: L,D-transpeptidase [Rhodoplanes sp.]|jgi:lipoprotein-anchoring transpeptidase ErfK/SrfK
MLARTLIAVAAVLALSFSTGRSQAQYYGGGTPYYSQSYSYGQPYTYGYSSVGRSAVPASRSYEPNTIIISTSQRRLYYITDNGQAISYAIGVGRLGFAWSGVTRVSAKREWPSWTPPSQMRRRQPGLPGHMRGGIDNPLGARALYLGSTLYRIHGSNEPHTIGQAVSSGCFRMTNEDVIDLYNRVRVGTKVIVQ